MWWARARRRIAFTLVELLTVVGIICVMIGLITTAILSAQESGRLAGCRSNLMQIHKVVLQYCATYGGYMPSWWHERWVGELGLVGKDWGGLRDDLNPNIPVVWGNFSDMAQYIKDSYQVVRVDKDTGVPIKSGGKYQYDSVNRNYLIRTPAPILICKSDSIQYRSDQGCVVSYLGLAKYGWWCRGSGGGSWFRNPIADPTAANGVSWSSPAAWAGSGYYGPYAAATPDKAASSNYVAPHMEYHQMTEFENTSCRVLLCETDPATWQYEPGSCGCRWYTYNNPQDIQKRHYNGGNILFMDGHVALVRAGTVPPNGGNPLKVASWEPDYDKVSPEY